MAHDRLAAATARSQPFFKIGIVMNPLIEPERTSSKGNPSEAFIASLQTVQTFGYPFLFTTVQKQTITSL